MKATLLALAMATGMQGQAIVLVSFDVLSDIPDEQPGPHVSIVFEDAKTFGTSKVAASRNQPFDFTESAYAMSREDDGIRLSTYLHGIETITGIHFTFCGEVLGYESWQGDILEPFPYFDLDYDPLTGNGSIVWSTTPFAVEQPALASIAVPEMSSSSTFLALACAVGAMVYRHSGRQR